MKPREMHRSAAETFVVCFVILLFERASADYFFHRCLNTTTNYTAGSPYETNRNQLLVSLTANASATGFYNDTAGQNPNTVYGRALCRGDLFPSNCTTCLTNARNEILRRCPFSRDAIIWFDECHIVHYSRPFVFNTSTVIKAGGLNDANVSNPTAFNGVWEPFMAKLVTTAASDPSLFYAAESINSTNEPTIYGLVQCCRDLSRVECTDCLGNGLADVTRYSYARGVRFLYDSCTVRYELYPFFRASAVSASNPPTGGGENFPLIQRKNRKTSPWVVVAFFQLFSSTLLSCHACSSLSGLTV